MFQTELGNHITAQVDDKRISEMLVANVRTADAVMLVSPASYRAACGDNRGSKDC
jgi:hypothetical protein